MYVCELESYTKSTIRIKLRSLISDNVLYVQVCKYVPQLASLVNFFYQVKLSRVFCIEEIIETKFSF